MRKRLKASQGFTLIEVMVVLAIIGILAILAIPKYTSFLLKTKFSEVVLATSTDKNAIELCVQDGSCLNAGGTAIDMTVATAPTLADGINFQATKYVQALNHNNDGTIIAASVGANPDLGTGANSSLGTGAASTTSQGFDASYSYILTPVLSAATAGGGSNVDWKVSGTCKTRSAGALC